MPSASSDDPAGSASAETGEVGEGIVPDIGVAPEGARPADVGETGANTDQLIPFDESGYRFGKEALPPPKAVAQFQWTQSKLQPRPVDPPDLSVYEDERQTTTPGGQQVSLRNRGATVEGPLGA